MIKNWIPGYSLDGQPQGFISCRWSVFVSKLQSQPTRRPPPPIGFNEATSMHGGVTIRGFLKHIGPFKGIANHVPDDPLLLLRYFSTASFV